MKPFTITIFVILGIIFLLVLILLLIHNINNKLYSNRFDGDINYKYLSIRDYPNLKKDSVSIKGYKNTILNGGIFYYPSNEYKGTIIFFHGLFCGYLNYLNLIEYFCKNNYKVVAFDFTGSMSSGGTSLKGMPNSEKDSDAILKFVLNDSRVNKFPLYVIGHSWGAHTAITLTLHNDKYIKKVVALAPFNSHVDCCYSLNKFFILLSPFIYIYYLIRFGHESTYKVVDAMNYSDVDMLIYCGGKDNIVKPQYAYRKYKKYIHEGITLNYLKDANHFMYMSNEGASYYEKQVSFPRTNAIDFKNLDYKLVNSLNNDLLNKVENFLSK